MAWWNVVLDNLYFLFILFRVALLAIGLHEMYKATRKPKDLDVKLSYKPTVMQEATLNLMTFGLVIICFVIIIYNDYGGRGNLGSFEDYWWGLAVFDVALGAFVVAAYLFPKEVFIAKEGLFHLGHLTPWKEAVDHRIDDRKGVLRVKHYGQFFALRYPTETEVPLPPDKGELKDILAGLLGDGDEPQKKKKASKKRTPSGKKRPKDEDFWEEGDEKEPVSRKSKDRKKASSKNKGKKRKGQ